MSSQEKRDRCGTISRRLLCWFVLPLFILYLVFCSVFYLFQERLLFEPNVLPTGYQQRALNIGPSDDRMLPVPGGAVHVQLFQQNEPQDVIFYLHGNKGNLDLCRWEIEPFLNAGYDVCMMDYRGFGESRGRLSETALLGDAHVVYRYLQDEYDEDEITVWGRSFGSGIAAYLAAVNRPRKLVLETPYYSLPDCVRHRHWYIPPFLFRYRLSTCDYVPYVECPLHLIHGTNDEKIYFESSEKLKEHCQPTKKNIELRRIAEGEHNLRHPRTYQQFENELSEILDD